MILLQQALRVTHRTRQTRDGEELAEILYGITSLGKGKAGRGGC